MLSHKCHALPRFFGSRDPTDKDVNDKNRTFYRQTVYKWRTPPRVSLTLIRSTRALFRRRVLFANIYIGQKVKRFVVYASVRCSVPGTLPPVRHVYRCWNKMLFKLAEPRIRLIHMKTVRRVLGINKR